jgi:hypothetical protein
LNFNRRALSHIYAWEARFIQFESIVSLYLTNFKCFFERDGNIPSALVCLKELLLAKTYEIDKQNASIEQLRAYQSTLALCIIRFVNFITEPYQKSLMSRAIKSIGNEIGLPGWIINMRHNSTHYNMPSIEILEEALRYLFDWLKERYVNTYTENPIEDSLLDSIKQQIKELINEYLNLKYKSFVLKKGKKNENKKELEEYEEKIETFLMHFKDQTFKILMNDGYLIPSSEQLRGIGVIADEFLEKVDVELPQALIKIWSQVLSICNQLNLMTILFKIIVSTYEIEKEYKNGPSMRSKFLLCWIYYFIKLNSTQPHKYEFHFNLKEILLKVLKSNPTELTEIFLQKISQFDSCRKEINNRELTQLKQLVHILCKASSSDDHMTSDGDKFNIHLLKDYTAHNINLESNIVEDDEMCGDISQNSKWKLVKSDNWNADNHKLGLLDGQSYYSLCLSLENNQKQDNDAENIHNEQQVDISKVSNKRYDQLKGAVLQSFWQFSDTNRMH